MFSVVSFNPRARAWRDIIASPALLGEGVSIHAPARGATYGDDVAVSGDSSFNPRARAGRDQVYTKVDSRCMKFQSTRPRGARLGLRGAGGNFFPSFNPRARAGRDKPPKIAKKQKHRFQSTRPRGARPEVSVKSLNFFFVSIHAPARGATRSCQSRSGGVQSFNPRARAGRDVLCKPWYHIVPGFQSTRPRGARPSFIFKNSRYIYG